jgi:hypothetical protein
LRIRKQALARIALALAMTATGWADCYPFEKASEHVGEIVCLKGRVMKVSASASGTHYLNFCENYLACPFTVVIFASRLDRIGDVRSLENRDIEIDGLVKLYNGRPEIVLSEADQLHGDAAARIPPLPKTYDVTNHGKFSAGQFTGRKPKRPKTERVPQDERDPMNDFSDPQ